MALTAEQKAILERNKQAALQKRQQLMQQRASQQSLSVNRNINNLPSSTSGHPSTQNLQNLFPKNNPQSTSTSAASATTTAVNNSSSTVNNNKANYQYSVNRVPQLNRSNVPQQHNSLSSNFNQKNYQPTSSSSSSNSNRNTNFNQFNNRPTTNTSTLNQTNQYNRTTTNQQFNRPTNTNNQANNVNNKTTGKSVYDQNYFVTPGKRPAEQNGGQGGEKRQNTQVKSPYEQVMEKSIPIIEISIKLASKREFYLDFKYFGKLIDVVKKFPTARYDGKNKRWCFQLEKYKDIMEQLKKVKIDRLKLKLNEGIPDHVLAILEGTQKYDEMKIDLTPKIPNHIVEKLFPYQREGIKFGIRREGRFLLADDCGLGKTMQAIGTALYYFDDWPMLIVCPSSVKFQWTDALLKWVPGLKANDIREIDSKKKSDSYSSCQDLVVITSYDSLHKVDQYIKDPKCAILDECHMIKDSKTKRYEQISTLVEKSKRLILISGTPAMSRPIELFTQLKLLLPKIFSNKDKYINRYCAPRQTQFGRVADGCDNPEELRVILESTVMVRRMKEDVLCELPPKRRVKVNLDCHLTSKDKSELEKFVSRFKGAQQQQAMNDENESFTIALMKTAQLKLGPIKNYPELILEKEIKFLFFAHHRTMIDGVCDFLNSKKITYIKIDGSTAASERSKCCEFFQNNEKCKAAVLSITAAGVGLNLTAAQLVLFGELYYTPGALIQAEDRVHRIGQKDSVYIEYLLAPGTVDDHIWNLVHKKLDTLDALGIKSDGFEFKKNENCNQPL